MPKKAILCVDDEEIILNSLRDQLQTRLGDRYIYEFAESAGEAMEVIADLVSEGTDILIIVSDWLMPDMKGDEFLIRIHRQFPDIVKVMLTGQADESAIRRVREEANLHRCLFKPWTEEELIGTIRSGLKKNE